MDMCKPGNVRQMGRESFGAYRFIYGHGSTLVMCTILGG